MNNEAAINAVLHDRSTPFGRLYNTNGRGLSEATSTAKQRVLEVSSRLSHLADCLCGPAPTGRGGNLHEASGGVVDQIRSDAEMICAVCDDAIAALDRIDKAIG